MSVSETFCPNFKPSKLGRSPRSGRTRAIGLCLPVVVRPAAAKRQPRALRARRGYCRPTGAAVGAAVAAPDIFLNVKMGPNVRQVYAGLTKQRYASHNDVLSQGIAISAI